MRSWRVISLVTFVTFGGLLTRHTGCRLISRGLVHCQRDADEPAGCDGRGWDLEMRSRSADLRAPAEGGPLAASRKRDRRYPNYILLLVALVLAAGCVTAVYRLTDDAAKVYRTRALVNDIESLVDRKNAALYEGAAKGTVDSDLQVEVEAIDVTLADRTAQLSAIDPGVMAHVQAPMDSFERRADETLSVLNEGRVGEALSTLEATEETYRQFGLQVREDTIALTLRAERAQRMIVLGSSVVLLMAAVVVGSLSWRIGFVHRRAEARAKYLAAHDALTGLPNRTRFVAAVEGALWRTSKEGGQVALLYLDLGNFKVVNDSLGHGIGDELLVAVGERLRRSLRPGDIAARLGGDEFAILLAGVASEDHARTIATRLNSALRPPFALTGHEIAVTASVGVAVAGDGSAEELIRDADASMYEAKRASRAETVLFKHTMNVRSVERLRLETQLNHGIAANELRLQYQPIVHLASGGIEGVEALVRWQHPRFGLLAPDAFLHIAEQSDSILTLGRWVLEAACRQMSLWSDPAFFHPPSFISVNISARELFSPSLINDVKQTLQLTGLAPHRLQLDIAETSAAFDIESAILQMTALGRIGVRLALDDFGTGSTGLGALKRFPVDTVKIARPFVECLGMRKDDGAIARAVIALADILGLGVIAEGVASEAQLQRLRVLGCGWGQGFFLVRPSTAADLHRLLRAGRLADGVEQHAISAPSADVAAPVDIFVPPTLPVQTANASG